MPQTLHDLTPDIGYARLQGEKPAVSPDDDVLSHNHNHNTRSGETTLMLATVGAASGAAFLGGTLAGPIGALTGTIIGIALGLFLYKNESR